MFPEKRQPWLTRIQHLLIDEYLGQFLVNSISRLPDNPRPRDGMVCLFPTTVSLRFYYEKLCEEVPCYTSRHEIGDARRRLIQAFSLCARPRQRFVERLLLEYFSGIWPRHKRAIVDMVMQMDVSPIEACQVLIANGGLTGQAVEAGESFIALSQALSSRIPELIADRIEAWTEIDRQDLVDILNSFLSSLEDMDQEEAISNLCDAVLPSTARSPDDSRSVLFLTMHGAKGLTKHTVIMPGLEDAWLPGTSTGSDLEERRRLFYVAFTRATDQILITHPLNRARGGPLNYNYPGRSVVSRYVEDSGIGTRYQG